MTIPTSSSNGISKEYNSPSKIVFGFLSKNENNSLEKGNEFCAELNSTLDAIKGKNPYINVVIGDLNAKNTAWYGDTTDYPGSSIANITNSHGLSQIIDQPTNFEPNKNPSCIDVIFASQSELIIQSGTLSSLLSQCHHNIIFAKVAMNVKLPRPYKRKMWDYKNANKQEIQKALNSINWNRTILHKNPENQVEFLSNAILNIFSNLCPNRTITCQFKDKPWMTGEIKKKLKEKTKIYKKIC